MGDAAGIGPEIIVKTLSNKNTYQICHPIVIGSTAIIQNALKADYSKKTFLPKFRLSSPQNTLQQNTVGLMYLM